METCNLSNKNRIIQLRQIFRALPKFEFKTRNFEIQEASTIQTLHTEANNLSINFYNLG
ncbi:MAG: hypothetical protein MUE85_12170 [Microscillaceae bacterium]|nr:hypothetical protein [Microscillaceae bacterium]